MTPSIDLPILLYISLEVLEVTVNGYYAVDSNRLQRTLFF